MASRSKSAATKTSLPPRAGAVDLGRAVVEAFLTNERVNQLLLEHLDEQVWNAPPPPLVREGAGVRKGAGRTIAAIVAHVHNVRHMWLVVSAKGTPIPDKLDRKKVTLAQAQRALASSAEAVRGLLERSVESGGRVKEFRPDVVGFLGYLVAHEAHHRGQICLLARQLGYALPQEVNFGLWDWAKRWKEATGQA